MAMVMQRERQVRVTTDWLAMLIGQGVGHAVPDEVVPDLKIVGVEFDSIKAEIVLNVESATFELSSIPQQWTPSYTRQFCPGIEQ